MPSFSELFLLRIKFNENGDGFLRKSLNGFLVFLVLTIFSSSKFSKLVPTEDWGEILLNNRFGDPLFGDVASSKPRCFSNFWQTSRNKDHSDTNSFFEIYITLHTHAPINLPIPVIAYFINTLDSQSSGRGRGGPNCFKVGGLFKKICTSLYGYANFRK